MRLNAPATRWRRLMWRADSIQAARARLVAIAGLGLLALVLARASLSWSAGIVAGTTLVIATLVQPAVGLVALALAIPLGSLAPVPLPGVNVVDLLVGLVIVAWLLRSMARREIVFKPPPLMWPLLAFVWFSALSLTQALSWREGLLEWLKWAEFTALYLVATQVLERRWVWWVLAALFTAGLLEVALGTYQFRWQVGPEAFILMGRFMRAYGTFKQPNPFAGYLGYLMPVALSLSLAGLGRWWASQKSLWLWLGLLCGGVAIALVAGIGMSWSRGAWLGLAAGIVVVVGFRNRRTTLVTVTCLVMLALLIAVAGTSWLPSAIRDRVTDLGNYVFGPDPARTEITDENFSVLERLAHWQAGSRMFGDHPWLGVGIGNYGTAYGDYALPHWYEPLGHAHNVYINFLAEIGILGFGAFLLFWLGIAGLALHSARKPDRFQAALAIGLLGTLTFLSIHSLFDNLFVQHIQLQLALLLGCLFAVGVKAS